MTLESHALAYASSGLEVFPVDPETKAPLGALVPKGHTQATADVDQVTAWWWTRPDALIGCRVPQNMVLIDIDPRHQGDQVWQQLLEEYAEGVEPATRVHFSGRGDGGRHLWFVRPDGVKLTEAALSEWATVRQIGAQLIRNGETVECDAGTRRQSGLDVLQHSHRYTILPPSAHPETGQPYWWQPDAGQVLPAPDWLLALIVKPDTPVPVPGSSSAPVSAPILGTRLDVSAAQAALEDSFSVADWFSESSSWVELLGSDGWSVVSGDGDSDGSRWKHPTATAAYSATISNGCLFVYSPTPGLPVTETGDAAGLTRFRYFTEVHHRGDGSEAAKAAMGLPGAPQPPERAKPLTAGEQQLASEQAAGEPLLRLLTADQITALEPPEPLVEGLLDSGALGVLYGPPGVGKSFYAISLALHLSSGLGEFHGRPIAAPGSPVIYLAAEGASGLGRRQTAWKELHQVEDVGPIHWAPQTVDLRTDEGVARLLWGLEETRARLLIVDTLNRNAPGTDEGAEDIGKIIAACDRLRAATGVTVLLVHHSGKDAGRGARGHSALNGAVDTEISATGSGRVIEVSVTKQKEGPELGPWVFGLEVLGESAALSVRQTKVDAQAEVRYLAAIGELDEGSGVSGSMVAEDLAVNTRTERRQARRAKTDGLVEFVGQHNKRRLTKAGEVVVAARSTEVRLDDGRTVTTVFDVDAEKGLPAQLGAVRLDDYRKDRT